MGGTVQCGECCGTLLCSTCKDTNPPSLGNPKVTITGFSGTKSGTTAASCLPPCTDDGTGAWSSNSSLVNGTYATSPTNSGGCAWIASGPLITHWHTTCVGPANCSGSGGGDLGPTTVLFQIFPLPGSKAIFQITLTSGSSTFDGGFKDVWQTASIPVPPGGIDCSSLPAFTLVPNTDGSPQGLGATGTASATF